MVGPLPTQRRHCPPAIIKEQIVRLSIRPSTRLRPASAVSVHPSRPAGGARAPRRARGDRRLEQQLVNRGSDRAVLRCRLRPRCRGSRRVPRPEHSRSREAADLDPRGIDSRTWTQVVVGTANSEIPGWSGRAIPGRRGRGLRSRHSPASTDGAWCDVRAVFLCVRDECDTGWSMRGLVSGGRLWWS